MTWTARRIDDVLLGWLPDRLPGWVDRAGGPSRGLTERQRVDLSPARMYVEMLALSALPPTARAVGLWIADGISGGRSASDLFEAAGQMGEEELARHVSTWRTSKQLARRSGWSERTVQQAIRVLEDGGWLVVQRRDDEGRELRARNLGNRLYITLPAADPRNVLPEDPRNELPEVADDPQQEIPEVEPDPRQEVPGVTSVGARSGARSGVTSGEPPAGDSGPLRNVLPVPPESPAGHLRKELPVICPIDLSQGSVPGDPCRDSTSRGSDEHATRTTWPPPTRDLDDLTTEQRDQLEIEARQDLADEGHDDPHETQLTARMQELLTHADRDRTVEAIFGAQDDGSAA